MDFAVSNPNFSAVLPGICNAHCPFCFWERDPKASGEKFLLAFDRASRSLPAQFGQLSITGGEPTLSPIFGDFLDVVREHRSRWRKVVLTSNGHNLFRSIPHLDGVVDHVNLSRHEIGNEQNNKVFGTVAPTAPDILEISEYLGFHGIDLTLSTVRTTRKDKEGFVERWVDFSRECGAHALSIRIDTHLGMEVPHSEDLRFIQSGHRYTESSCPVCRTRTYLIRGFPVTFKYGVAEPSDTIPYELVLQQNGDLTLDWAGKKPFEKKKPKIPKVAKKIEDSSCSPYKFSSSSPAQVSYACSSTPARYESCGGGSCSHRSGFC